MAQQPLAMYTQGMQNARTHTRTTHHTHPHPHAYAHGEATLLKRPEENTGIQKHNYMHTVTKHPPTLLSIS